MMAWMILLLAGCFEIGWAIALKYSYGFTRFVPSAITVIAYCLSILLLGIATKTLPLGTAYAVWTGIGAVGAAVLGIILFHEPCTAMRMVSLALIVCGIIGLRLFAGK